MSATARKRVGPSWRKCVDEPHLVTGRFGEHDVRGIKGSHTTPDFLLAFLSLQKRRRPPGGPPAVGVVRVAPQEITQTNEFIGRIQAIDRVSLVARVTAFLEQRLFIEGTEVKKGDLLYRLEQPPFQAPVDSNKARVAQLEAQHTFAEQQLARAQSLLNTPAGPAAHRSTKRSPTSVRWRRRSHRRRRSCTSPQINLAYTEIRAPISGKISRTAVTEGNVVSPTQRHAGDHRQPGPDVCDLPDRAAHRAATCATAMAEGRLQRRVIRLRLPDGRSTTRPAISTTSPTVAENTDTIILRGVIPNPPLFAGQGGHRRSAG